MGIAMIGPDDIQNKVFDVRMRGYDREQVDEFLLEIVNSVYEMQDKAAALNDNIERLEAENTELKRRAEEREAQLELARYQMDEKKKSAELESRQIIDAAQIKAEEIKHDIDYEHMRRQEQISEFKAEIERMRGIMRGNCRKLLEFLDTFDSGINQ